MTKKVVTLLGVILIAILIIVGYRIIAGTVGLGRVDFAELTTSSPLSPLSRPSLSAKDTLPAAAPVISPGVVSCINTDEWGYVSNVGDSFFITLNISSFDRDPCSLSWRTTDFLISDSFGRSHQILNATSTEQKIYAGKVQILSLIVKGIPRQATSISVYIHFLEGQAAGITLPLTYSKAKPCKTIRVRGEATPSEGVFLIAVYLSSGDRDECQASFQSADVTAVDNLGNNYLFENLGSYDMHLYPGIDTQINPTFVRGIPSQASSLTVEIHTGEGAIGKVVLQLR